MLRAGLICGFDDMCRRKICKKYAYVLINIYIYIHNNYIIDVGGLIQDVYMCACVYVGVHVCMHVCMYVRVYVCRCAYMHACVCIMEQWADGRSR